MVRLSFLYLTSVTNQLGVNAAAAVGIASKYDVFAMLPATSAANALSAIVAQNYGAGKYKRMNQSLAAAILFALPFSTAFFLWAQLNPESMIRIFSSDPAIIAAGIPFFTLPAIMRRISWVSSGWSPLPYPVSWLFTPCFMYWV